jgi:hypothetical protein
VVSAAGLLRAYRREPGLRRAEEVVPEDRPGEAIDPPTIDEGSNACGSRKVERYMGERQTMVSDCCLALVGCSGVQE